MNPSITQANGFGQKYQNSGGSSTFYQSIDSYSNPHKKEIHKLLSNHITDKNLKYLDLAAGDGLVTEFLLKNGCEDVQACEPYIHSIFSSNFPNVKCHKFTFEDISIGSLKETYDVIICSYALHLVEKSFLPNVLFFLSQISRNLVVLTPHKRPEINRYWKLSDSDKLNKTKLKIYSV